MKTQAIEVTNLAKSFELSKGKTVQILNGLSLSANCGEFISILGVSGSGKSTLLNLIGGIETIDEGDIVVGDVDLGKLSNKDLTLYRRNTLGFVFQFYNLVPNLTAKENVELASEIVKDAMKAEKALENVGLGERMDNFPAQLSGGEQQRLAIARAVAKKPKILLCDEPTGALDYNTGKQVLKILQDMSVKNHSTVIIVTHNAALAPIGNQVIHIHDGQVKEITRNANPADISSIEW